MRERLTGLDLSLYVINRRGVRLVNENASWAGVALGDKARDRGSILTIPPLFAAGEYIVGIWVGTDDETFVHGEVLDLSILPVPTDRDNIVHGAVRPNVRWDANPGGPLTVEPTKSKSLPVTGSSPSRATS